MPWIEESSACVLSLSLMLLFAGCASKTVASSSGDVSLTGQETKIEQIQPDAIKMVPPGALV